MGFSSVRLASMNETMERCRGSRPSVPFSRGVRLRLPTYTRSFSPPACPPACLARSFPRLPCARLRSQRDRVCGRAVARGDGARAERQGGGPAHGRHRGAVRLLRSLGIRYGTRRNNAAAKHSACACAHLYRNKAELLPCVPRLPQPLLTDALGRVPLGILTE